LYVVAILGVLYALSKILYLLLFGFSTSLDDLLLYVTVRVRTHFHIYLHAINQLTTSARALAAAYRPYASAKESMRTAGVALILRFKSQTSAVFGGGPYITRPLY